MSTVGEFMERHLHLMQIALSKFHWSLFLWFFVLWEVRRMVWTLWWKAPKNVTIAGWPTIFGRYLTAIRMLFNSDRICQDAYDKAQGQPFAVPLPDKFIVFITDRDDLERLERNTPDNLSEIEALFELASTNQVLADVNISSEQLFRDGSVALRKHLRSNLPAMSCSIRDRVEKALDQEISQAPLIGNDSWRRVPIGPALLRSITRVNVPMFVGANFGEEQEVFETVMSFFWSCLVTLVIITITPSPLLPVAVPILMNFGFSRMKLYNAIIDLAQLSIEKQQHQDDTNERKQFHLVQWVADSVKIHDAIAIAKTSLGLIFGSAYQIPILTQSTLFQLCNHPQYIPTLTHEAQEHEFKAFTPVMQDMPHVDSFIKETARLSPGLILSVPRRVMNTSYVSPDNMIVPPGNWLAIPQYIQMRDAKIWPGGTEFRPFRFVGEDGSSISRLTHPSYDFPYWGSIRHACPARFYAAVLVKTIITRLLCHYEFRLEKPDTKLFYTFGMIRLTNPFMNLLVRKKSAAA